MKCEPKPIEGSPGLWRCVECGHQNKRPSDTPFKKNCGAVVRLNQAAPTIVGPNERFIAEQGPSRTDAEVLYIIANYCMWCPAWNTEPTAKKKCKYCGCGSTETIENLHRRRIRNCPKRGDHPAKWTEATIQQNLHGKPPKPT